MKEIDFDCFAFTDVVIIGKAYVVVVAGVVGVVRETKLDGDDNVDETVDVVVSV
jgi:hypothetical protein